MNERTALADLIRRARRRLWLQLALHALSDIIAVFLAGLILVLLAGSEILGWPFLAALAVVAAVLAVLRLRPGVGSPYRTAQQLDRRLGFPDSLSTALYFSAHAQAGQPEIIAYQRGEAERAARSADLSRAFPFCASRGLYASAALLFAAGGMFFLRFGITHRLDLRPPLVHLAFQPDRVPAAASQPASRRLASRRPALPAAAPLPWQPSATGDRQSPNNMLDTSGSRENDTPGVNRSASASKAGAGKSESGNTKSESSSSTDPPDSFRKPSDASASSRRGDAPSPGAQGTSPNSGNSRGLMDRMKDAMSDLLSTLKPNPGKQGGAQSKSGGNSQSGARQQAASRSNTNQAAANPQRSAQDANAQGAAGAQAGQQAQSAAHKRAGDSSSARSDSPDANNGIGTQDGNKDLKYAEELAAMGKISELIGKRSANVTGEVMVESASGSQQLKTQYSNRSAVHSDAGGEIDRDEVPLAYQQYVQQYFEQIRKTPAARSAPSGAKQ